MFLRFLGTPAIPAREGGDDIVRQPKRLALVAFLAAENWRGPIARDTLLPLFWPEADAERARNALNQALHVARTWLGANAVVSVGSTHVRLDPEVAPTDVDTLRRALARADHAGVLDAYGGELLDGIHVPDAPEFERWLAMQRRSLREAASRAARELAREHMTAGRLEGAIAALGRAIEIDWENEGNLEAYVAALAQAGRHPDALSAIGIHIQRLRAEFDIAPGERVLQLRGRLEQELARAPQPPIAAMPPRASDAPGNSPPPRASDAPNISPRLGKRRRLAPWLFVAPALIIAVLGPARWMLISARSADVESRAPTVAVAPFLIQGDPSTTFLGEGVATVLSTKLDVLDQLHSLSPQAVTAVAPHPPSAVEAQSLGRRLGATFVVTGQVTAVGDRVAIDAAMASVGTGRSVAFAIVEGRRDELNSLLESVATRLTAGILPGDAGRFTIAAGTATSSLPALRAFIEGERLRRSGRFRAAAAAYAAAAQADSAFGLAHYRHLLVSNWANLYVSTASATALLARDAERLTPRHRDLLAAAVAYLNRDAFVVERLTLALTRDYRDEPEAWYLLGETLFHYGHLIGRDPRAAESAFQHVVALEPGHLEAHLHLARLAAQHGDRRSFEGHARVVREAAPEGERTIELEMIETLRWPSPSGTDQARAESALLERLRGEPFDQVNVAAMGAAVFARSIEGSAQIASLLVEPGRPPLDRARGYAWMAQMAALRNDWAGASALLDSATGLAEGLGVSTRALMASSPRSPESFLAAARFAVSRAGRVRPGDASPGDAIGRNRREYLLALLAARAGDTAALAHSRAMLAGWIPVGADSLDDYTRAATGLAAFSGGRWAEAADLLLPTRGSVRGPTSYTLYSSRGLERATLARALVHLGRQREASEVRAGFAAMDGSDLLFQPEWP